MDRYMGLDAHASSCALAVVGPSGSLCSPQFVHSSCRHIDRGFGIGTRGRVAIGNGNQAKWLSSPSYRISRASNSVTVAPAIDSNTLDISVEIEQFLREHTA